MYGTGRPSVDRYCAWLWFVRHNEVFNVDPEPSGSWTIKSSDNRESATASPNLVSYNTTRTSPRIVVIKSRMHSLLHCLVLWLARPKKNTILLPRAIRGGDFLVVSIAILRLSCLLTDTEERPL
jgi:hypothetical protein